MMKTHPLESISQSSAFEKGEREREREREIERERGRE